MTGTNSKTTPAPKSEAVIHSPVMGDVTAPGADPFTPPEGSPAVDHGGEVVYNKTVADLPEGERCIAVLGMARWITPIEAKRLARQLDAMARRAMEDRVEKALDD